MNTKPRKYETAIILRITLALRDGIGDAAYKRRMMRSDWLREAIKEKLEREAKNVK